MNYSSKKKKKIFKNSHFEAFLDHRNDVNFFHGLTAATSEGQAFSPLCFTWHRGNFHCRSLKDTEWVFILYMITQTFGIPELWAESLLLVYLEWARADFYLPSCKSTKFLLKPNQLPGVEQIPSEQVRLKSSFSLAGFQLSLGFWHINSFSFSFKYTILGYSFSVKVSPNILTIFPKWKSSISFSS